MASWCLLILLHRTLHVSLLLSDSIGIALLTLLDGRITEMA